MTTQTRSPRVIASGTPSFRRTRLAMFVTGFTFFTLLYFVQALLPVFSAEFGVGPADSALALSGTTGVMAFALVLSGVVSDRFGRKAIMIASLASSSALTVAMAAMGDWAGILAVRVLMGISLSGVQAVAMAYLAEEVEPAAFGVSLGLFISGSALGGMAGRLVAGVLADVFDWRVATLVLGVAGLAASLVVARILPASRNFTRSAPGLGALVSAAAAHLREPVLVALFAVGFLMMGSFVTSFNYVTYRLLAPPFGLSQFEVGLVFLIYLVGIPGSTIVGALLARFHTATLLAAMLCLMLAGFAASVPDVLPAVLAGLAMLSFGFFSGHALASGWVSRRAARNRALAASLYLFTYYQGSSVVGYLGGFAWQGAAWTGVVFLATGLVLAALAIAAALRRV